MELKKTSISRYQMLPVFLFFFLLFSYPVLSLLWRRSYPFLTLEAGALFMLVALVSVLLAFLLKNVRPVIMAILSAVLITVVLLVQFNLFLPGILASVVIGMSLAWLFRERLAVYGTPVLLALIAGAFLDSFEDDGYRQSNGASTELNRELPPVIHILLDGFIGVDGLPSYPATEIIRSELDGFFSEYGFEVAPRAYSRFDTTGDSLNSAFNFKNEPESKFTLEKLGRYQHNLASNRLFKAIQSLGYRQKIYQTDYMDFCESHWDYIDRCWQYAQPNVRSIQAATGLGVKLKMFFKVLIGQSELTNDYLFEKRLMSDQGIANHDPRVFGNLAMDILKEAGGSYFFAHVLLPHGPFAFLYDCSINYDAPVWSRYARLIDEGVLNESAYEVRTMKYFEQMDCALRQLRLLFDSMQEAGIYGNSIIVLHGDHGSAISKYPPTDDNAADLTQTDYKANYSTLFALKMPGFSGFPKEQPLPLSSLLEMFSKMTQVYVTGEDIDQSLPVILSSSSKIEPFIYLRGSNPMNRVDIDVFAEPSDLPP